MPKNLIPFLIVGIIIAAGALGIYFILNQQAPKVDIKGNTEQQPMKFIQEENQNQQQNSTNHPQSVSSTSAVTQLTIEDQKSGEGPEVKSGDTIVIHYTGTLENGQKFDSSLDRGQPFETQIGVGQVIKGWDQGVIGMKVGGRRKLIIPSDLAYGQQGIPGAIPANATLIFEVELLEIK